jgi:hypothetical protein
MSRIECRGVVQGGVIVPQNGTPLKDGTEVVITPVAQHPGTSAAVLAALNATVPVPTAWVDELEHLIAQGRRQPARLDPFGEAPG